MSKRRSVLKGRKISDKHGTYTPAAGDVIRRAAGCPLVRRVVLGIIKPARPGASSVICKEVPAGLRVKVRSGSTVQELYVYTNEPWQVAGILNGNRNTERGDSDRSE